MSLFSKKNEGGGVGRDDVSREEFWGMKNEMQRRLGNYGLWRIKLRGVDVRNALSLATLGYDRKSAIEKVVGELREFGDMRDRGP
ncbi:MAG: hypothetical protein J6333_00870 [Planctomycetes bacterium]|nr:hypothetical protein [Planctomycetota bacterium]